MNFVAASDNSIGAIPLVITLSHSISADKIPDPNTFLKKWYAQFAGNPSTGATPFNVSDQNWLIAAPTTSNNGSLTINSQASSPYTLYDLAWNQNGSITPYLFASKPDYTSAYNNAGTPLADVFSSSNPDIRVNTTSPTFPVFWLSGMQSGALILASGSPAELNNGSEGSQPTADLKFAGGGAPAPFKSGLNYVLHEGYYGLDAKSNTTDSNNGDATYIEQFSIPNSLILWYADSNGNLYRGIRSASGANLSIPGVGSFLNSNGQYQSSYNNGLTLANEITQFASAQVFSNKPHGTLYANPKDTFGTEANAILDPAFGDYYQYQYILPSLYGALEQKIPVTWTGSYAVGDSTTYYQVTEITLSGFDNADPTALGNPLNAFDSNAYAQLSVNHGSSASALSSSANIIVPWLGYNPNNPAQTNHYSIVSPGTKDSGPGPSGGWKVDWNPNYNTVWIGSDANTSTNLNAFSGTTPVSITGGQYGATNLFQYYSDIFQYDAATSRFTGKSLNYTQNNQGLFTATGDTITAYPGFAGTATGVNGTGQWIAADGSTYSVTFTGKPDATTQGTLNLGGEAGNTVLQIQYVSASKTWQVNVPTSQGWTSQWQGQVQKGSTFSVAGGGFLPGTSEVSVTVTVETPPSQSITPAPLEWSNFSAANGAVLQAMVDADGNWLLQGNPTNAWNGSGIGTSFAATGLLPNGFQPTFTLAKAPDSTATSDQVGLIYSAGDNNFSATKPITSFTATDPSGTTIATLTPNSIWKANQLIPPAGSQFVYAANEAGIAGANAGSYTLDSEGNVTATYPNISQSWDSGGVVGDYLSLLNAGLLGATQPFVYGQNQAIPVGQLYTLQQPGEVSPWFDKVHGPVANGLFGQNAWLPADQQNNYWNTWSSLLNTYAPSVYSFGLSDRFANSYDINLNLEAITPRSGDRFLQYNEDAATAEQAFTVVDGGSITGSLYPLFIEYQIGGFGQPSDPGYNPNHDFLPDYNQTRTIIAVPTPQGEKQIRVEFRQGQLVAGSDLQLLNNLELDPVTLQTLSGLGVVSNATGIAFQLDTLTGTSASLNSDLDLVAADLLSHLSDASGRLANRRLLAYSLIANGGGVTPLSFDPVTGTGAQFFDLNNDGIAEFFTLSLIDGMVGDTDGQANGRIAAASFSSYADLPNLGFSRQGSDILTVSDPTTTAPVGLNLSAKLLNRPESSNQIGYVVLKPEEQAAPARSLQDPGWWRSRARILFHTLEAQDLTLSSDADFQRDIRLLNGQSLRFFEVVDGSLDQLDSLSDSRFRMLSLSDASGREATYTSETGTRFVLSLRDQDPGLNALISQEQDRAPVLDLTPLNTARAVEGSLTLAREADLNAVAGFYRTMNHEGAVLGSDGLTILNPGDAGYAEAALRSDNVVTALGGLSVADNEASRRNVSFRVAGVLAPFAQVNGETFFAYGAANRDGLAHFRVLGNNSFGLEDLLGGGDHDFDDLIISFDFKTII